MHFLLLGIKWEYAILLFTILKLSWSLGRSCSTWTQASGDDSSDGEQKKNKKAVKTAKK